MVRAVDGRAIPKTKGFQRTPTTLEDIQNEGPKGAAAVCDDSPGFLREDGWRATRLASNACM